MNSSRSSPADVLTSLNQAWVAGRLDDLEHLLHPQAVIVGPDLTRYAQGRQSCIASYRDFLAAANVRTFEQRDVRVDEYGGTAIVTYAYELNYELDGEEHENDGREMLVLVSTVCGWQVAWRQLLTGP